MCSVFRKRRRAAADGADRGGRPRRKQRGTESTEEDGVANLDELGAPLFLFFRSGVAQKGMGHFRVRATQAQADIAVTPLFRPDSAEQSSPGQELSGATAKRRPGFARLKVRGLRSFSVV